MAEELYHFSVSEVDDVLGGNNRIISSSLTPLLQEWMLENEQVDATVGSVVKDWLSDLEDVKQTSMCVDANPFPGEFNFNIQIEDSDSKHYTYSEKLHRLYCGMDRAVPIIFKWEGTSISHVRAMLVFKDPDHLNSPVLRCPAHNDEKFGSNQGCKHFRHIVRCDSENTIYKENVNSRRHSVTTLLGSNHICQNEVKGAYRFMCHSTCPGVDAIARRRTNLVLTLEDSNYKVVGRAVIDVKICSCPLRDKRRDEGDGEGRKKRKCDQTQVDSKKRREPNSDIVDVLPVLPPSLLNVSTTTTNNNVTNRMSKREVEESDYIDLQVKIPNFPFSKVEEFQNVLKRLVTSYYITDDDVNAATTEVKIHEA